VVSTRNVHVRVAAGIAVAALGLTAVGLALSVPSVGWVIARHQPGHRLAWVFSAAGLGAALTLLSYSYARYALEAAPAGSPGGVAVGWISSRVWTTGVIPLVTFGVLLFPDGRLPSPRWRPVAVAALAGILLLGAAQAPAPGPLVDHPVATNPLGVPGAGDALELVGTLGFALFCVAFLAGAASIVVRWRRG
jgi:two-component system, NarL family, sensor kinase